MAWEGMNLTKRIQIAKKSQLKARRRRVRLLVPTLLAFFAFLLVSSGWQLYQLHSEVAQNIARLNEEKVNLLNEKKDLEDEIVQLNTPSYIEQLAREQLGLVRKGEIRIAPKKQ